jgi:hypothetical protein
MNDPFPHSEIDLIRTIGTSRSVMREFRKTLVEGIDFQTSPTGIHWSQVGHLKLIEFLKIEKPADPEAVAVAPEAPTVLTLAVVTNRLKNPALLPCVIPGDSPTDRSLWKIVRIRPGHIAKFKAGTMIQAQPIPSTASFQYMGGGPNQKPGGRPIYPRAFGRW